MAAGADSSTPEGGSLGLGAAGEPAFYHGYLPPSDSQALLLATARPGAFLLRASSSRPGCFSLDLLSEEKSSLSVIKCLVVKSVQDSSKWLFPTLPSAGLAQLTVSSLDDLLAQAKTALRYPVIMQGTSAADLLPQFETVFTASSGGGVVEHQRGKSADRSGAVDLLQSAARSMVDDVEDDVTAMHSAGKPTATQGPSSTQTTPQFDSSALGTSA